MNDASTLRESDGPPGREGHAAQTPFDQLHVRSLPVWTLACVVVLGVASVWVEGITFEQSDLAGALALPLVLGLWMGWVVWRHGVRFGALLGPLPGRTPPRRTRAVNAGAWRLAGWGLATFLLVGSASYLLTVLLGPYLPELVDFLCGGNVSDMPTGRWGQGVLVVAMVVLAPLFEEVLFRGFLFTRWSRKWGGFWRGALASSLAFCVLHPGNVIGSFVFGLVLCVLYARTRTLWVPIAAHALANAAAAGLTLSGTDDAAMRLPEQYPGSDVALAGACLVLTAPALAYFFWKSRAALRGPTPYARNAQGTRLRMPGGSS